MADANVDLNFIAAQIVKVLDGQREMRAEFGEMRGQIDEMQIALAATRADLTIVKNDVEDIKETARLIEGRIVRLEKHAGFAKA